MNSGCFNGTDDEDECNHDDTGEDGDDNYDDHHDVDDDDGLC